MNKIYPYYGDETTHMIAMLASRQLRMAEEGGSMTMSLEDGSFTKALLKLSQRTGQVLEQIREPGEKRYQLARRLHMAPATLTRSVSEVNPRQLTRNSVLTILLWMEPLPTCDEADHLLMELAHPGLFTRTGWGEVNRRNQVLRRVLDYARTNPCPVGSWGDCANLILEHFGMEMLYEPDPEDPQSLPWELYGELEQWRRELGYLKEANYKKTRNDFYDRYIMEKKLDRYGGRGAAADELAQTARVSLSRVNDMFVQDMDKSRRVSREVIIRIACAMGCTLHETNLMLLEGNEELLYPNRSNEQELEWVQCLEQNRRQKT